MRFAKTSRTQRVGNTLARRWTLVVGMLAAAALVGTLVPGTAFAGKSTQTEAVWVKFDADASTVTVKVKKPGRGNDSKRLKRGKEATFNVKIGGSVLTKTTVSVNGKRGELHEIPGRCGRRLLWCDARSTRSVMARAPASFAGATVAC